jgi:hypothetical protein
VVVKAGDVNILAVVSEVFQVTLEAPVAVNVTVCPAQIDAELIVIVGVAETPTAADAADALTQPFTSVPVTL